jgi:anti-sigma regulatory factor (Ser/Thr protein kinase)
MWTLPKNSRQMALEHSQLESVILQRTAELQNLSLRLLKVQDEERRKLSRDLHDTTGQTLAALKIAVSFLQENSKHDPSQMRLASDVTELADQAIQEIRTMSYLLHPPLLDEVGFACAAEWYIEGFAKRSGVNVNVDIAADLERLPTGMETALFRVLQESLTNVHRHSGAAQVIVSFRHQLDKIILEVRDDGRGIPAERLVQLRDTNEGIGVGLAGMRERMQELNGKLEMESDGHGTTIRAVVPRFAIAISRRLDDWRQKTASFIPTGATVPMQPTRESFPVHQRRWNVAVAATAVFVLTCGIAYSGRHAASFRGSLELQEPIAIAVQGSPPTAKAATSEGRSRLHTEPVLAREPRTATLLLREGTSEDEVVHIGDDVTVRYFTRRPAPHRFLVERYQAVHIGKDVTVWSFPPIVPDTHTLNRSTKEASESSMSVGTIAPSEKQGNGAKAVN